VLPALPPQRLLRRAVPRPLRRPLHHARRRLPLPLRPAHHPEYRERFAANLKRELPRIPFAPDFRAFSEAGRELARLHVDYESLDPWPLQRLENPGLPYSERIAKMKFSESKESIRVNEPQAFDYRLGSRSALEWIIDQYQVKADSDPNSEDDPAYIVRLIGQVIRVSIETTRIIRSLPIDFAAPPAI
jgi:predicted helicase